MTKHAKFLQRLLNGRGDTDISFADLCSLLKRLGFQVRVRGNHHIFTKDGVAEIINLQPLDAKTKPYQVKQVRNILLAYHMDKDKK